MYKHTFYYFLGNRKYPEIYILPSNLPTIPTVPTVPDIPTIPTITPNLPTLWLHKVRNDSTVVAVCWRERRADGGENQISNHPTRRKVTPCENILYTFDRHWQDWMWAFLWSFEFWWEGIDWKGFDSLQNKHKRLRAVLKWSWWKNW